MGVVVMDARTSLEELFGADVGGLDDHGLVEAMVAARRLASRAQAVELAAVAELVRRRHVADAEDGVCGVGVVSARDYVNDEVAEALTLSAVSADDLIRFATGLTGRLPGTFAALADGDLDYCKARTVWHCTAQVSDEVAAAIETRLLPRAPGQSTGEIRAKIRRLVRRLDPDALARRRARAVQQRDLQLVDTDDGTAHLTGVDLPADAASAAFNRVNAIAAGLKSDGDRRGAGQLRADVFLALLSGTLTTTEPPTGACRPPAETPVRRKDGWTAVDDAVADIIAQTARDQLTVLTTRSPTGLLDDPSVRHRGLAAVIAELHRELPWRHRGPAALVTQAGERMAGPLTGLKTRCCVPEPDHAPGRVHGAEPDRDRGAEPDRDHGYDGYRVPAGMRRLIESRDRRCCFPGCRRPTHRCDADHTIPFHRGGPTCPCNVAMLCRHHHSVKQTRGWRLQQLWPGVLLWITPTGHWRITAPADRE
ncbi:MAG TPA: DUF222 domain-containing protein [Actinoallomurus sp.]|nr:DUF222 domain-containing protein [Actinoallomurus sp.]